MSVRFSQLRDHAFEIFLSLAMILATLRTFTAGWSMSQAVDRIAMFVSIVWQGGIVLASIFVLVGVIGQAAVPLVDFGKQARLRVLERTGCILMATACIVFCIVIAATNAENALFSIAFTLALTAGFIVRAIALRKDNEDVLAALRSVTKEDD